MFRQYLPILEWLPQYQERWLCPDAIAALVGWALLCPDGMSGWVLQPHLIAGRWKLLGEIGREKVRGIYVPSRSAITRLQ